MKTVQISLNSRPIDLNVHADGDALQTVLDVLAPYIV